MKNWIHFLTNILERLSHNGCHDIKLYYETPKISLNDGNGIPLGNFSLVRKKLEPCKKLFIMHLTKRILWLILNAFVLKWSYTKIISIIKIEIQKSPVYDSKYLYLNFIWSRRFTRCFVWCCDKQLRVDPLCAVQVGIFWKYSMSR